MKRISLSIVYFFIFIAVICANYEINISEWEDYFSLNSTPAKDIYVYSPINTEWNEIYLEVTKDNKLSIISKPLRGETYLKGYRASFPDKYDDVTYIMTIYPFEESNLSKAKYPSVSTLLGEFTVNSLIVDNIEYDGEQGIIDYRDIDNTIGTFFEVGTILDNVIEHNVVGYFFRNHIFVSLISKREFKLDKSELMQPADSASYANYMSETEYSVFTNCLYGSLEEYIDGFEYIWYLDEY